MAWFICPNCKHRSMDIDGVEGFSEQAPACRRCGFGFLFELLDDYYPAPTTGFVVCDAEGRILALGRGICGAAAAEKATIIVDDVNAEPRYLACSVDTKSEIVVPIMKDGDVLGEIDIDSDRLAAFGDADKRLLEAVAALLADRLAKSEQENGRTGEPET